MMPNGRLMNLAVSSASALAATSSSSASPSSLASFLSQYHPIFVEGMGGYDTRDPIEVSHKIVQNLEHHWKHRSAIVHGDDTGWPLKPKILMIQGDPLTDKGISAITRKVADLLNIPRALILLDEDIASYHSPNADRHNAIREMYYSEIVNLSTALDDATLSNLTDMIEQNLREKTNGGVKSESHPWPITTGTLRFCKKCPRLP